MLTNILDQQGLLFNKLQKNAVKSIKYRLFNESSTTLEDKKKEGLQGTIQGTIQEGFSDQVLNQSYDKASAEYAQAQADLQTNNLNILKRMDPKTNAYLGKNIMLNDEVSGYVTDQGVFKAYNPSTLAEVPGKFGCPLFNAAVKTTVNEADQINSSVPGYTFTTPSFPNLLVGPPMQSGEACGSAGKNIYVDRLVDNPTADYVGCYSNSNSSAESKEGETNAMVSIGAMDYASCLTNAMNNGYAYFGMSTDPNASGQPQCLVSNSLTDTQQFGTPAGLTPTILWSSNTTGTGNYCTVTTNGTLSVYDASDAVLFQSNDPVSSCISGGRMNDLVATYGGNCDDKYNVETGNATESVMTAYNNSTNTTNANTFSFLINGKAIGGNPASGCSKKSWDASYNCGNVAKSSHISNARGKNAQFDCKKEAASCTFSFILNNKGNACLFQHQLNPNKRVNVWCAFNNSTTEFQANPEFNAVKGKTGTNSLNNGQTLFSGEWIGSKNGSLRLIMQSDGNLCLYSYNAVETCKPAKENSSTLIGAQPNVNAVYQVAAGGNKEALGKLGYIDKNDVMHPYAADALEYSDKYTLLQNMDSTGNDLTTLPNSTMGACKTACADNDLCAGFSYESGSNVCYLKNNNMYPTGKLAATNGTTTGVRLPQVSSANSCATETQNISSEKYEHYIHGDELSKDNWNGICNPFASSSSDPATEVAKKQYTAANKNLADLGGQMTDGITRFGSDVDTSQDKFHHNSEKMMKSVRSYKTYNNNINSNSNNNNNKDGFSTIKTFDNLLNNNLGENSDASTNKGKNKGNMNGKSKNKNNNNMYVKYKDKEGMLNMQDIYRMKDNSEFNVLHENMQYVYWTLLALGLMTTCIIIASKS